MRTDEFSTADLSARVLEVVGPVQAAFRRETGEDYDERLVEIAIRTCILRAIDRLRENMLEMFTTPGRAEYEELRNLLERNAAAAESAVEVEEMAHLAKEYGDESIFEGFTTYSNTKMAAMIEYLVAKGQYVYRTSLNKLLFYSDLTNYYLTGHGISGAVYDNRPYGPVAAPASPVLNELISKDRIKVDPRTHCLQASVKDISTDALSDAERRVLDWVIVTYGSMNASAISGLSHTEMAYRFTDPNEPIAYGYAKFLKYLPPADLLDR